VQVDPLKPKLKPPGVKHLKLICDVLLSSSAFKLNLRRYTKEYAVRFRFPSAEDDQPGIAVLDAGHGLTLVQF